MKAVTWHGKRDVRVESVPDPRLQEDTDAIIRVTSTAICGSDLHLYELFGPFLEEGDILGHEAMGIVEEVGRAVRHIRTGDRVVVPFNISCGTCWMCQRQLYAQCETTQVREHDTGGALFGYTKLYGQVAGGQAEYVRVPQAHFGPILEMTDGRGTDAVSDAVGIEAHGSMPAKLAQTATGLLPDAVAGPMIMSCGVDRLAALLQAIDTVRRGGTLSMVGVYGGMADPLPMLKMFDKGIQVRMGQAHVRRWTDQLLPLMLDASDPLGLEDLATHYLPLADAPRAYELFQRKQDGAIKIVLCP